jgi:DNA-binding response OmpR family regulator
VATAEPKRAKGPPVVLVIDDEDYVADMIAATLELEGFEAHVAYNGRDGLAQFHQLSVDLVIIDVMMPYLNGPALIRELRGLDHGKTIPIVLISAGARPRERLPGVTFIPKPFDIEDLLDVLSQASTKGTAA